MNLYFDGASRGNPGKAAYGCVVYDEEENELFFENKYIGNKTNNVAEYCGLIQGLELCVKNGINEINVYGDSKLVLEQMKGNWRVKSDNLMPYWQQAKNLEKKFSKITYNHVYRKNNKRADKLANMALDAADLEDENES